MDITAWMNYGWPVALLVLVLSGMGVGLGWFLKAYLKQQKEDFDSRKEERIRQDKLLTEQHEFIRELASTSLSEASAALAQMSGIKAFMSEMTRSLAIINEQLHDHSMESKNFGHALKEQNAMVLTQVAHLERTAITKHNRE